MLALIASAQPWWHGVAGGGAEGEGVGVKLSGSQATGGLSQALAVVALAGTLLMLVLRSFGRRLLGGALLLVGVGVALVGALGMQPRPEVVRSQLGHVGLLTTSGITATAWPWIFALAGPFIAIGAALVMITAATWPAASDRFQPGAQLTSSAEPAELWKAMDAGLDPTTDDHDAQPAADPEMRDRRARDTMDGTEQAAQQLPWSSTRRKMGNSTGQVQRGRGDREA